ncbi:MAG: hypothetical protein JW876_00120 [Candidatus Krumholzibacteriota bacterium]|nr:hypothetical protein [Candidatus Krumholzibacteriota bacterium]
MLRIVDSEKRIAEGHALLRGRLATLRGRRHLIPVGHQGGGREISVTWIDRYRFWYALGEPGWNAFGVIRPDPRLSNAITCEINFPAKGINRHLGGAFAEDGRGGLYVVHRGTIGGGRRNIGKTGLADSFTGRTVEVDDGGKRSFVFPVCDLRSKRLPADLGFFVWEVARYKDEAVGGGLDRELPQLRSYVVPPLRGLRVKREQNDFTAAIDDGYVVNTLANTLGGRGLDVDRDRRRDLYVRTPRGRISVLFAVERSLAERDLQAAVGRLVLDAGGRQARLVLVLPAPPREPLFAAIRDAGVRIVTWRFRAGAVELDGLAAALA